MARWVAFLRAIAHVPMEPFRRKMEALGFTDVETFGMSGNILFSAPAGGGAALEVRIGKAFGTRAFVRSGTQLRRVAASNPFRGESRAVVAFLARPPGAAGRQALRRLDVAGRRPVPRGAVIYFLDPVIKRGGKSPVDLTKVVGVPGTIRAAHVVERVLDRLRQDRGGAVVSSRRPGPSSESR